MMLLTLNQMIQRRRLTTYAANDKAHDKRGGRLRVHETSQKYSGCQQYCHASFYNCYYIKTNRSFNRLNQGLISQ